MLVFSLMLIAGGLVVATSLVIFMAENLFALICAALAARVALATGGGWLGAIVAGALTFAIVTAALRLSILLARSPASGFILASLIILPAALSAFCIAEALLWPLVPASPWRMGLALVAAAGAYRRLWPCEPPLDQTGA